MMNEKSNVRNFNYYSQNRRLWDVDNSRYATIVDIVEAISMGLDVKVQEVAGRGKSKAVVGDVTLNTVIAAFHHQQREHPTVAMGDLIRLMQGEKPLTWVKRTT